VVVVVVVVTTISIRVFWEILDRKPTLMVWFSVCVLLLYFQVVSFPFVFLATLVAFLSILLEKKK
jgi:hypothetical protein